MAVVLMSIISTVAISQFTDFQQDAREAVTRDRMSELKTAIVGDARLVSQGQYLKPGFETHMGGLPNSLGELAAQGSYSSYNPFTKRGWRGPYVSNSEGIAFKDSWGVNLSYNKTNRTITSCGRDGVCGNSNDLILNF